MLATGAPPARHGQTPCPPAAEPSARGSISCWRGARGAQRGARGPGRGRHRQVGAARVRGRARQGCRVLRASGRGVRDGAPLRRAASAVRAADGRARSTAIAAAGRVGDRVRARAPGRSPIGSSSGSPCSSLLSDAAGARPLVWLVDDAQWLDRSSAQVLAFVARRLEAEGVLLLFAEREPGGVEELDGLPELRLGGLADAAARELLRRSNTARLDERVRGRIIAETRGNPLALLELPREVVDRGARRRVRARRRASLPGRIEASFRQRVEELPAATQRLLLVAAAEPLGEPRCCPARRPSSASRSTRAGAGGAAA